MLLRTWMTLLVFITGIIGISALVVERTYSSRETFYGRAEARAQALGEIVANLVSPALARGDVSSVNHRIEAISKFPNLASISILDRAGNPVSQTVKESLAYPARDTLETRTAVIAPNSTEPLGQVQVLLSTESLEETLRGLFWRSIALSTLGLIGLAGVAWTMGLLLGRRLESLAGALESVDVDQPLKLAENGTASELDRLARGFNALHKRLLQEKAARAELETFRDDLTNMLIHDMKHPITIMRVILGLLEEEVTELDHEKKSHLFSLAKKSIQRENIMIENLLQMARLKESSIALRRTLLNLKSFLEACAEENALIVQQDGREWRLEISRELGKYWILGDSGLLKRLISNLVFNAIDHSPPKAGISLGARLRENGASIAEIFVHNEGPGIPKEQRKAIFQKYHTLAESTKNAGLGLAFCKLVAERHEARLDLLDSSRPGTTFALVIPATARTVAPEHQESSRSDIRLGKP